LRSAEAALKAARGRNWKARTAVSTSSPGENDHRAATVRRRSTDVAPRNSSLTRPAQRVAADHRANPANRNEIRRRHGPAATEEQRHDAEALARGVDGKCAELTIERFGQRSHENQ
jgi:hypothetical protein